MARTCARGAAASPARGAGRNASTRIAGISPGSTDARSGRASSWAAPSRARSVACRIVVASSAASEGASTQRAPASPPRRRSMLISRQARGSPSRSMAWRSGRSTASRKPSEPSSLGRSLRVARRTVSAKACSGWGSVPSQSESTAGAMRSGPAISAASTRSTGRSAARGRSSAGACRGRRSASPSAAGAEPADGLLERRAAEHHEASARLHEATDRRPGLERERAAVGQQQDVCLLEAQARREGLGRVEDGDRQSDRAPAREPSVGSPSRRRSEIPEPGTRRGAPLL